MSHRKCKTNSDKFCHICGELTIRKKQKDNDRSHKENLFCILFLHDWRPRTSYGLRTTAALNVQTTLFSGWFSGKMQSVGFAVPMIWREQIDHTDCYFCITEIEGYNEKTRKNIEYPDLPSATRPVSHTAQLHSSSATFS